MTADRATSPGGLSHEEHEAALDDLGDYVRRLVTAALTFPCARTGGPRGTAPCLARPDGCAYCALSATRIPPPTREEPPRDRRS